MYNEKVYKMFMELRYPFASKDYKEEWKDRFMGGNPEKYMDSVSLNAYKKAKYYIKMGFEQGGIGNRSLHEATYPEFMRM